MAIIAMMFVIRSSVAINCTQSTFQQDLDQAKVAAAQLIVDDYATETQQQIIQQIYDQYGAEIIQADYTVTKTSTGISISYQFIFACNETTTTTQPDGTQQTQQITSPVNKTQVENSVACGL